MPYTSSEATNAAWDDVAHTNTAIAAAIVILMCNPEFVV